MAKTREARILLSRRKKREERRKKNRHGIVVEEMALRPLNSRLLSSQPRNSAYFQLNLLIIAPPLWNSSPPLLRLLFIRSVESPARGGHYTVSSSRYPELTRYLRIFRDLPCAVQVEGCTRADHSPQLCEPALPLVIFTVIKYLLYWNKRWISSGVDEKFGRQLCFRGRKEKEESLNVGRWKSLMEN